MRLLVNLLLLAGACVLGVLMAEGLVRLFAPQDRYSNFSWYEAHPVYRFRHRPHLDRRAWLFDPYHLRTNARGLREDEDVPYGRGRRWRVVVHGDSFTLGQGVENEHAYVNVAERYLRSRGVDAELLNLGVSGHGPGLEYLYFREEGRRYAPQAVAVGVFLGNDVMDDVRDAAFELQDGALVFRPYEIPRIRRFTDHPAYQLVVQRSHLLALFKRQVVDRLYFRETRRAFGDAAGFEERYRLTEAVLLRFAEEIRHAGARPLFLLLPTREQIRRRQNRAQEPDPYALAEPFRQKLLAACAAHAVRCLDLLPALAAAPDPDALFIRDGEAFDFHYNASGHRIVGQAVGKALEELYREEGG